LRQHTHTIKSPGLFSSKKLRHEKYPALSIRKKNNCIAIRLMEKTVNSYGKELQIVQGRFEIRNLLQKNYVQLLN